MALKHTRIFEPDPTKPQPGTFEAGHVDEMGNPPPLWVYGGADGKTIVGIKKPDGSLAGEAGNLRATFGWLFVWHGRLFNDVAQPGYAGFIDLRPMCGLEPKGLQYQSILFGRYWAASFGF